MWRTIKAEVILSSCHSPNGLWQQVPNELSDLSPQSVAPPRRSHFFCRCSEVIMPKSGSSRTVVIPWNAARLRFVGKSILIPDKLRFVINYCTDNFQTRNIQLVSSLPLHQQRQKGMLECPTRKRKARRSAALPPW